MAKAIIYTRVSTAGQATDGVSLDAQEAKARSWAEANGYEIGDVWSDAGISGKRATNRPALTAALDAVCADRGNVLVVYSLSLGEVDKGCNHDRGPDRKGRSRSRFTNGAHRYHVGGWKDGVSHAGCAGRVRA
jgi:hypothetical protein